MNETNNQTLIKCEVCGGVCKNKVSLARHLSVKKCMDIKEYYDKYFKQNDNEGECYTCGKNTRFGTLRDGYFKYCCSACVSKSPLIKDKKKQTCLNHFGVPISFQSNEIKDKIKKSMIEKYGVDNASKYSEIQQKKVVTSLKRYGVEHPSQTDEFKQKIRDTCLEKYGESNVFKVPFIKQKGRNSCLIRYGVNSPMQSADIKEKSKNTCLLKYGVIYSLQSKLIREKIKQTCLVKYGKEFHTQNESFKQKIKKICRQKYGYEHALQNKEFLSKMKTTTFQRYGFEHFNQSEEGRLNCRNNAIYFVEQQRLNGENLCPRVGPKARKCLDELQKLINYQIKREVRICGFFADGYIDELKLVIEFDELFHKSEHHKKRDLHKDICYEQLALNILRIDEFNWINNQSNIIQTFLHKCS